MEKLIYDRTQEDVTNKSNKGYHNYTDLNRIEEWSKYISDLLNQFGYRQSVSVKTNWNIYDERTVAEIERIRMNLLAIRNSISVKPDTPQVPDTLNKIDVEKANAIERILADIEYILKGMTKTFVYSGVAGSGQVRIWQQRFRRGNLWSKMIYKLSDYNIAWSNYLVSSTDTIDIKAINVFTDITSSINTWNEYMTNLDTKVGEIN